MRRGLFCLLATAALCLPASPALAAPGELDPSFGNGGRSIVNLGGVEYGDHVALQPDGKIVVAGARNTGTIESYDIIVARLLNPQGTLDLSYVGGAGWSPLDYVGIESSGGVALQPDGKIVVGGGTIDGSFNERFALARLLNPQGTFDGGSFASPDGFVTDKFTALSFPGAADQGTAVGLQGSSIIVGGSSTVNGTNDFAATRVLSDGSRDFGFGNDAGGIFLTFGGNDFANDLVVGAAGDIVLAGAADNTGLGVVKLTPGGLPDASFSGDGKVSFPASRAEAVELQPDGKILVVGSESGNFLALRLMPNGDLDGSFGAGGKQLIDFGGNETATTLAMQPDSKIVVGGAFGDNFSFARLQPNGQLDSSFGNGGRTVVAMGPDTFSGDLVLQPDGRIVYAGSTDSDLATVRLQGDPPGEVKGKCRGKEATIIGTNAKDKLKGTKKKDVISAGKGNDTVKGLGGNDLICGGKGRDGLFGGAKKDTLLGEASKDRLFGGKAKDTLKGGKGKDLLVGGPAKDKLNGGPGKDAAKQ